MRFGLVAVVAGLGLAISSAAMADGAQDIGTGAMNRNTPYDFKGGQAVYTNVCQGCHMPDGKGAAGAGMYVLVIVAGLVMIGAWPCQYCCLQSAAQTGVPSKATVKHVHCPICRIGHSLVHT